MEKETVVSEIFRRFVACVIWNIRPEIIFYTNIRACSGESEHSVWYQYGHSKSGSPAPNLA